ncbi:RyR domain-containing protein [Clostridium cylindrosporum]|uniref:RyR domain protein n=1 Tax=Clostridium cylindrosporum DSM 605 TaxID=1121307 RepID=A0A0J8DCK5_CLOCY|nr:RyR domain-containing protein [Clostridium cylindrosporum]KMT21993.1 RyR domain protein [Clostridium cylindrosporum DSM 605]
MKNQNVNIVVTGDIAVNLFQWRTNDKDTKGLSFKAYPRVHKSVKLGDDFLLSKLVALGTEANVISPKIDLSLGNINEEALISTVELGTFPKRKNGKEKVFRVKEYLGFQGPKSGVPKLFNIINDDENADIVILDDENNGFNSSEEFWPVALKTSGKSPIIIYKTNNLASSNNLWNHLEKNHLKNTIVVINADDLRSKGVNISKSLSWERTALDFVWQMNNNPNLTRLSKCHNLIIPLGVEGAIHYKNAGKSESELYFLTYEFEGGFIKEDQGKMFGLTSCFVAGLARNIVSGIRNKEDFEGSLSEGIREGIVAAQKYFINGLGSSVEESLYPDPIMFTEGENDFIYKENIQDVKIRNTKNPNCRACWYIIKDKNSFNLAEIAYDIVKNGEKSALKFIPIAQFGKLKTVDRTEIEAYRSIKNLMSEYISSKNTVRPLSIAVFGTPGSGKSFGVTEIASSIAPNLIEKLDFNLSQFQTLSDLIVAFHKVRDLSLEGKLPLVFFDEFDSAFERKLGWLKYFLAPMQDGKFREGDATHPIGKAIFVFAGGTSSTFNEFCGEDIVSEIEKKEFKREFQASKGPDFVSRLRGYVNILGPNQTDEQWDQLFIIRRAMLLRTLLERKVPHLIGGEGEAQIDDGVLRALLKVPRYKHESRSMEAILEMSMLNEAKKWEQAHLPSKEQLKLHVDEEEFSRLLMQEEFFSEKIEKLARELYEKHIEVYGNENKTSIRRQARHIPIALHKVNYDLISVMEKPEVISFTEKELSILAEYEHKRSSLEKKEAGWTYGEKLDKKKKTHPSLVPWDSLPSEYKDKIIENVKSWPEILANSNFKIERLKFLCNCETQLLP